ncbi:AmmeMemoRadiSam system radical SAM enzyme [bacterium]|nr:AmmeMemoRadiSam system radical SAM enzyme [bacterium]
MKEALFYHKFSDNSVKCELCPRSCIIEDGGKGYCGVRMCEDGKLFAKSYGVISGAGLDPIEKKPLYNYFPGKMIFSVGSFGCNLKCPFCQNVSISGAGQPDCKDFVLIPNATPESIVRTAIDRGSFGIAFTYNEPLVNYEFMLETAELARQDGLKNVLVTNGQINPAPLDKLIPFIDAANIDLKSIDAGTYRDYIGGDLGVTLNTISRMYNEGVHIEITHLMVTGHVDSIDEIEQIAIWIKNLGMEIPFHISRYFPMNLEKNPPTTPEALLAARKKAMEFLKYVYVGNFYFEDVSDTICSSCGQTLITRTGYDVRIDLDGGKCPKCGTALDGVF